MISIESLIGATEACIAARQTRLRTLGLGDGRNGAYLTVGYQRPGGIWMLWFMAPIGTIPDPEKAAKYARLSPKKLADMTTTEGEMLVLSSQNTNPVEEKFGGGIRIGRWLISISGLTPDGDEVSAFRVATEVGIITTAEACATLGMFSPIGRETRFMEMTLHDWP